MPERRYLKWNGIYSRTGHCNVVHDALNTDDGKLTRLRALGLLPAGIPKATNSPGCKEAVRVLHAFTSLPPNPHMRVRIVVTTENCAVTVTLTDKSTHHFACQPGRQELIHEPPSLPLGKVEVEVKAVDDGEVKATFSLQRRARSNWRPLLTPRTLTAAGKQSYNMAASQPSFVQEAAFFDPFPTGLDSVTGALKACEDIAITHKQQLEPKSEEEEIEAIRASRNTGDVGSGVVLQVERIGVAVTRVPRALQPFHEQCHVELTLEGFASIQSMLFRVYRNAGDADPTPDQVVYQEVLSREQIEHLTRDDPAEIGLLAPLRGAILRRRILDRDAERFKQYAGPGGGLLYYDRAHAPYRFRVWVSSDPAAFNGFRDGKSAALPADDDAEVSDAPPQIEEPRGMWGLLQKAGKWALPRLFTADSGLGRNESGEPCELHRLADVVDNRPVDEPFVALMEADPLRAYAILHGYRQSSGSQDEFPFAELKQCCDNIHRHAATIRRDLCCGPLAGLDQRIKDFAAEKLDELEENLRDLAERRYPYTSTVRAIGRFVIFWNAVVSATYVRDEFEFHDEVLRAADGDTRDAYEGVALHDPYSVVNFFRNNISGHPMLPGGITVLRDPGEFKAAANQSTITNTQACLVHATHGNDSPCACGGELIVYPAYRHLTPRFFVAVRAIPIWTIAVLDAPYTKADRNYMQPTSFFEHDLFHATDGNTTQQWKTQYDALQRHLAEGLDREEVRRRWQANVAQIQSGVLAADPGLHSTLWLLFFYLLHEPVDNAEAGCVAPAVPERRSLQRRIAMGPSDSFGEHYTGSFFLHELRRKIDTHFFGLAMTDIRSKLDQALPICQDIVADLDDLEKIVVKAEGELHDGSSLQDD